MTDYRALCIELTDCLEKADWPLRYRYVFRQWVDIARAALAAAPESAVKQSLTTTPPAPLEGEVAEVAAWLRAYSDEEFGPRSEDPDTRWLARAADLLEQRHPAPVPVSERLPGPEDCDAEGRCWLLTVEDEYPQWRLHSIQGAQSGGAMIWVPVDSSPGVLVDCFYTSHWLPAHALPIPHQQQQQENHQ